MPSPPSRSADHSIFGSSPSAGGEGLRSCGSHPTLPGQSVITYRRSGARDPRGYDLLGARSALSSPARGYQAIHLADWDGNAAAGRSAPEGLYFLRLVGERGRGSGKLILIRR